MNAGRQLAARWHTRATELTANIAGASKNSRLPVLGGERRQCSQWPSAGTRSSNLHAQLGCRDESVPHFRLHVLVWIVHRHHDSGLVRIIGEILQRVDVLGGDHPM